MLSREHAIAVDRELVAKGSLIDFVEMAWREVEPKPFRQNWHHGLVCDHLEALSRCEIRNLVINEPPGCTKSLIVNVLWPAWEWVKRPDTKFIYASFDVTLVGRRDGGKLINLLRSPWFTARWGQLLAESNPSTSNFDTLKGGFRFSTSPGGRGTGRHGDIIAVDDPIKPRDAAGGGLVTRQALTKVLEWWSDTMSTRQANPETHRNLIVMQRLHNMDLAGHLLRTGDYIHLCLPMRFVSDLRCRTQWGEDPRTYNGELLFPQRFPEDEVKTLEKGMTEAVRSAQLQQRPTVEGGGIFKRADWRFWAYEENVPAPCLCEKCFSRALTDPNYEDPECPERPEGRFCEVLPREGQDCQSWDMSFKDLETSDYVAAGFWRQWAGRFFLVDFLNERLSFVAAQAAMIRWDILYPTALDKLVEDKANGTAIVDQLKTDIPGLTPVEPLGGKVARATATSPLYAALKVFLPHPKVKPGVWQYMAQHEGFPKETNDDLVDQASQALLRLRQHGELFHVAMARIRGEIK